MVERRMLSTWRGSAVARSNNLAVMADANPAAVAAVVAEDHFQDRGFAGARRARQHHALTRIDVERDAAHHGQFDAALQVHGEGLLGVGKFDHRGHWHAHGGRIEETSNCV
ncbi:hypothetical protein ABIF14_005482 [Bradyrhizobium elkanii]